MTQLRLAATVLFLSGAALDLAACRPALRGLCEKDADCHDGATCSTAKICVLPAGTCNPVCTDGKVCNAGVCGLPAGPSVAVSINSASDSVGGWFPRNTSLSISVNAQVTDAGSDPESATLTIDTCPAGQTCGVYLGVLQGSIVQGVGTFRFTVPRSVQAPLSEAKIPFTVKARDKGGNEITGTGSLQIDDKAPVIGATVALITSGTTGEDGKAWFPAGTRGLDVEISLPAQDSGAGLSSADSALTLVAADIDSGQSTRVASLLPSPADGTIHFKVPTTRVAKREEKLHFSIVVKDKLGHASSVAVSDANALQVDDLQPTVRLAQPQYLTATPDYNLVCARPESATFHCGRGDAGSADHALRDDTVPVVFEVLDCGVGLPAAPPTWTVESGGQFTAPADAIANGTRTPGGCANGSANPAHLYRFDAALASVAPLLDAPDQSGRLSARLSQSVADRLGLLGTSAAATAGDGTLAISLWRWRAQLGGLAAGMPALLRKPGPAGTPTPRPVAVPLDPTGLIGPSTPHDLEVLDATGALLSSITPPGIPGGARGDVAAGESGTLFVPAGTGTCGPSSCARMVMIEGAADAGTPAVLNCPSMGDVNLGPLALGAPDLVSGVEPAAAITTRRVNPTIDPLWSFAEKSGGSLSCTNVDSASPGVLSPGAGNPTGLSLGGGRVFVSHGKGFFSRPFDSSGNIGGGSSQADYSDGAEAFSIPAGPSLLLGGANPAPFFSAVEAGAPNPRRLRQAQWATSALGNCGISSVCWIPAASPWADAVSLAPVSHTPVFDGSAIYDVDDLGHTEGWSQSTGAVLGTGHVDPIAVTGSAVPKLVSPPVILQGTSGANPVLIVQSNGLVRVVRPFDGSSTTLLRVGSFASSRPPSPVLEAGRGGGIAYVVDGGCDDLGVCGQGWVWALQLQLPPLAASATAWPRAGRDSCNTRHAEAACP